ncbi:hypothetical protein Poly30_05240 [Planctomycetes bacterium Poly30]|uniref:Nickel uptake substrate-specific transmembrane region n=1 Tax=Saltatorellus ferox TaxID=2528018 RepID=A0A518ELR3_9BACT|nr:hypothetical protein Poly30_05240 [Planctomycetes bacterium Poly30]
MIDLRISSAAVCSMALLAGALWLTARGSAPRIETVQIVAAADADPGATSSSISLKPRMAAPLTAIRFSRPASTAGSPSGEAAPPSDEFETSCLTVRVLDPDLLPIPRATITLSFPIGDQGATFARSAVAGTDGNASIKSVQDHRTAILLVSAPGHESRSLAAAGLMGTHADVVLPRRALRIHGVVLTGDGHPAGASLVFLGAAETRASKDGSFSLQVPEQADFENTPLVAMKRGLQPLVLHLPATDGGSPSDAPLELILGEPTKTLRGRLVDSRGEPLAGHTVSLSTGTPDGRGGYLEHALDVARRMGKTDRDGRFEIRGLMDRSYELSVSPVASGSRRRGARGKAPRSDPRDRDAGPEKESPAPSQLAGPFDAGTTDVEIVLR